MDRPALAHLLQGRRRCRRRRGRGVRAPERAPRRAPARRLRSAPRSRWARRCGSRTRACRRAGRTRQKRRPAAGLETAGDRLLGDDREFRPQLPERTGDERLGARVGCGSRRAVRLFPGAEVGAVKPPSLLHRRHGRSGRGLRAARRWWRCPSGGKGGTGRSGQSNRSVARAPRDAIPPCHGGRAHDGQPSSAAGARRSARIARHELSGPRTNGGRNPSARWSVRSTSCVR